MYPVRKMVLAAALVTACVLPGAASEPRTAMRRGVPRQTIDLAQALEGGRLRAVNREVTGIQERNGVRLSSAAGNGLAWVEGTEFRSGTIELDIRGKDIMQRSFVGVAFHRKDDHTYEAVYLRPFNFRAEDPVRRGHAVQYIVPPEFDWPRLRKEFPEEFENPVDASLVPTDWVRLRVTVEGSRVRVSVGRAEGVTLEVRKLGQLESGQIGLWVGNGSDGDFANLVVTPARG